MYPVFDGLKILKRVNFSTFEVDQISTSKTRYRFFPQIGQKVVRRLRIVGFWRYSHIAILPTPPYRV